jgi:hypothetical protein
MKFDEFYILQEIGKIQDMPTDHVSDIHRDTTGDNFQAEFIVAGKEYTVDFNYTPFEIAHIRINAFTIDLTGPKGILTTNLGVPHQVYTQLLLIVKKFIQQQKPEGLIAIPADPKMQPIYTRFFKRFGANFARVGQYEYLNKDLLKDLSKADQDKILYQIKLWSNYTADIADIRQDVNRQRKDFLNVKDAINKIVIFNDTNRSEYKLQIGIPTKVLRGNGKMAVITSPYVFPYQVDMREIRPITLDQLTPDLKQQLEKIKQLFPTTPIWTKGAT